MSAPPRILFDTSILRGSGWTSSQFQSLIELSKHALIEIYIPEIAFDEWRTQWRDKQVAGLESGLKALLKIADDKVTPSPFVQHAQTAKLALEAVNMEAASTSAFETRIAESSIKVLPLTLGQAQTAWRLYFKGHAPFKNPKDRNDIPDAFIFASIVELSSDGVMVHAVCADVALREALTVTTHVTTYDTLESLSMSDLLVDVRSRWERDKSWKALYDKINMSLLEDEVTYFLESEIGDHLFQREVRSRAIPSDDRTATIGNAHGYSNVHIGNVEDYGGGLLSYPFSIEITVDLEFVVFKGDALNLPAWADVQFHYGDDEYYLDGYGQRRVHAFGRIEATVNLSYDPDSEDADEPFERLNFSDSEVHFIDDDEEVWTSLTKAR